MCEWVMLDYKFISFAWRYDKACLVLVKVSKINEIYVYVCVNVSDYGVSKALIRSKVTSSSGEDSSHESKSMLLVVVGGEAAASVGVGGSGAENCIVFAVPGDWGDCTFDGIRGLGEANRLVAV